MVGFSVTPIERRVAANLVDKFRSLPCATISDCMSRMAAGGPQLRPMHCEGSLFGPAFTVKTRPGDNLLVHKALDMALPGDVIVVDAGGDLTNSIIGEHMAAIAKSRGIAGFVIYGAIRDYNAIKRANFPIFAAGITHRGPYKTGPGEIGRTIAIEGMVIEPGDLITGDDDGVLCVPFDQVGRVYAAASKKMASEQKVMADVLAGKALDRSWVDQTLSALGCNFTFETKETA